MGPVRDGRANGEIRLTGESPQEHGERGEHGHEQGHAGAARKKVQLLDYAPWESAARGMNRSWSTRAAADDRWADRRWAMRRACGARNRAVARTGHQRRRCAAKPNSRDSSPACRQLGKRHRSGDGCRARRARGRARPWTIGHRQCDAERWPVCRPHRRSETARCEPPARHRNRMVCGSISAARRSAAP